jgi:hypothetical protein
MSIERGDLDLQVIQALSRGAFDGALPGSHTVERSLVSNQAAPFSTGVAYMNGGSYVVQGRPVSGIRFLFGATAAAAATHCWFGVCYSDLVLQKVTTDDTTATPTTINGLKRLDFPTLWVPPKSGPVWLILCVSATTLPTTKCVNTAASTDPGTPKIAGETDTFGAPPALGTVLTTPTGRNSVMYADLV